MQESIIHRARQGDQRAFQQLVEEYHDIVWRTARVLLPDAIPVEDSIQEAWIDTWRSLSSFKEGQPFRPWLLTIVANRCRMTMRRRHIPIIPIESVDEDRLISNDDPITEILIWERAHELQSILTTLPIEQQQVLQLRFFADLELAEIAQIMDIPSGTVKSRLHRALNTLRTNNLLKPLTHVNAERML